jgi:hypothetical protein
MNAKDRPKCGDCRLLRVALVLAAPMSAIEVFESYLLRGHSLIGNGSLKLGLMLVGWMGLSLVGVALGGIVASGVKRLLGGGQRLDALRYFLMPIGAALFSLGFFAYVGKGMH